MAKRSSKKGEHDFSVIAHRVVQEATGQANDALPEQVEPELAEVLPEGATGGRAVLEVHISPDAGGAVSMRC